MPLEDNQVLNLYSNLAMVIGTVVKKPTTAGKKMHNQFVRELTFNLKGNGSLSPEIAAFICGASIEAVDDNCKLIELLRGSPVAESATRGGGGAAAESESDSE